VLATGERLRIGTAVDTATLRSVLDVAAGMIHLPAGFRRPAVPGVDQIRGVSRTPASKRLRRNQHRRTSMPIASSRPLRVGGS